MSTLCHILTGMSIQYLTSFIENYLAYEAGVVAGVVLLAGYLKLRNLPGFHRHDGYVSVNGSVWNCSRCGRPPASLEEQLAEVRAEMAEHRWMGPYMGPDRAEYDWHGQPKATR